MGKFFISRPIFAIAIAIAIVIIGTISLLLLSVEQYPNITPPVVQVSATYEGADAQSVNSAVATPLAQSIMGVSDLLYLQTTSANDGSMTLTATFNVGADPDISTILTQNRASTGSASLPSSVIEQGVTTTKITPSFMMVYALHSTKYDALMLTNYADINIEDELLKIDGVGEVQVMGASEYAMRIWLDPQKMAYYKISATEITQTIKGQGAIYPAGEFGAQPSDAPNTYTVVLPAEISTAEEFGEIIIRSSPAQGTLHLRDLARIELGGDSYSVKSLYGDEQAALFIIYQSPGSNAVELGKKIRAKVAQLEEKMPEGVECSLVVDSTSSIEAGIKDIFTTLIIALILVVIIIFLFLQHWRATLIPLIAIPVSLLGAFIIFPLLGFSINIISLLALVLAIGLVVDDAIVVVEAVEVNLNNGSTPIEAAQKAMQSVTSPIIATTVVLLAVLIPVSFIPSVTGLLFRQFAITVAICVTLSAFNALTLSPALCAMLLRQRKPFTTGFFGWFNRSEKRLLGDYSSGLSGSIRHTARTSIFVGVIIGAIVVVWQLLPKGFLPEEDQGYVMVMVETPENSSLNTTLKAMEGVSDVILTNPNVESVSYAAGYNLLAGISSSNSGVAFIMLKPFSKRKESAEQIASTLNGELWVATPEAMSYAFIPPAIPGLGLEAGATFEVQDLEGRGNGYLTHHTDALIETLKKSKLFSSVTTQSMSGITQKLLDVDLEHAIALSVEPTLLYDEIGTLLGGSYIGNFNRFGRLYQTYIEAAPEFRDNDTALNNIYIANSNSEQIPLSSVVSVRDTVGVNFISQFNLYESIAITATPADKVSSKQAMTSIEKISNETLPPDIAIAWSGVSLQESEASQSGAVIYILALVFVFLSLAALYNSWTLPFSILLSVPIAVIGALIFTWLAHFFNEVYLNDIYLQISLVMLIGLSAKNSILVIEYAHRMLLEDGLSALESAIGAAKLRVRPIIMTAFAFILGVTPLIFASGVYSTARNIMGIALVGGMLFATLGGIFIYPALYYLIAKLGNFEKLAKTTKS